MRMSTFVGCCLDLDDVVFVVIVVVVVIVSWWIQMCGVFNAAVHET